MELGYAYHEKSGFTKMADRIKTIYEAIDQMAAVHGTPRPKHFGGGTWNFDEEIKIWKKQIIGQEAERGYEPLTPLQWHIINTYIVLKRKELK